MQTPMHYKDGYIDNFRGEVPKAAYAPCRIRYWQTLQRGCKAQKYEQD